MLDSSNTCVDCGPGYYRAQHALPVSQGVPNIAEFKLDRNKPLNNYNYLFQLCMSCGADKYCEGQCKECLHCPIGTVPNPGTYIINDSGQL